jgi:hypothetical protein
MTRKLETLLDAAGDTWPKRILLIFSMISLDVGIIVAALGKVYVAVSLVILSNVLNWGWLLCSNEDDDETDA